MEQGNDLPVKTFEKLSESNVYQTNPFINDELVSEINSTAGMKALRFETKSGLSVITKDGEMLDNNNNSIIMHQKVVDKAEFTKVFKNAMKIFGLGNKSSYLLMYITSELGMNSTEINLHYEEVNKSHPMSQGSFYKALTELVNYRVLARTKYSYKFFINPLFLFNGNRLTVVNQYIMKNYGSMAEQHAIRNDNSDLDNNDLNAFDEN